MNDINTDAIKIVAEHALNRSRSNIFTGGALSDTDVSCIAEAITAAIEAYDQQRNV